MARCLVLGGGGFIGSHLVDQLALAGHTVTSFDRSARTFPLPNGVVVTEVTGDFTDPSQIINVLRDAEYVFHLVSATNPILSQTQPQIELEKNIDPSLQLFDLAVEAGVKRVLFISSGGSVYGLNAGQHTSETVAPAPVSPYAIGKITIEHFLRYFHQSHGLDYLTYRLANPYGERQNTAKGQGVIPIFIDQIHKQETLKVYGDGNMVRDYIYIQDAITMILASFDKPAQHHTYNLGSGEGVSVTQIIDAIQTATSLDAQIDYVPKPATFVDTISLDISRFTSEFGAEPSVSLQEGIGRTVAYYRTITA